MSDRTKDKKINQALEDAVNAAESANRAKSTFLSNMSHDEDKKAALDSGMNGFISKPIVVDEVVEALKGVILS